MSAWGEWGTSQVPSRLLPWIAGFFACWSAYGWLHVYPGYVHQDTAEIFMWSQTGWAWGYAKHPPLLPWLFRAVDAVVPLGPGTLVLLAAANLTLGAWAVLAIATRVLGPERLTHVLLLIMVSPFSTWQAIKLNHNSILISLWPLAILAFLRFRDQPDLVRGAVLGAIAGLAVLAKFYSAILLFAMLLVLLPDARRFVARPGAWVAGLLPVLMVAPHLAWIAGSDLATLTLGFGDPDEAGSIGKLLSRNAANAIPITVAYGLLWFGLARWRWPGRVKVTADRPADYLVLAMLFVVPFALTLVANRALELRGSSSWTMPVFAILPVLLAGLLPTEAERDQRSNIRWAVRALMLLTLVSGPLVLTAMFRRNHAAAVEPRYEFAAKAERLWRLAQPEAPLRLVAGDHQLVMTASLTIPAHPVAWPNFSVQPYMRGLDVGRIGWLALCEQQDGGCVAGVTRHAADRDVLACSLTGSRTLHGREGRPLPIILAVVAPLGAEIDVGSEACQAIGRLALDTAMVAGIPPRTRER